MEKTFKVARWLANYSGLILMVSILWYIVPYVVLIINHKISIYTLPIPIATFFFTIPIFTDDFFKNTIRISKTHRKSKMLVKNLNIGTFFSTIFKNEVNIIIHEKEQT